MTDEVWLPVPGFDLLEASNWGRIRSRPYALPMPRGGVKTVAMAATAGYPTAARKTDRYKRWQICFRRRSLKVARLVCLAFHGERGKDVVTLHIDENSGNNRPENLRWGTQKENLNAPGYLEFRRTGVYAAPFIPALP